NLNNVPRTTGLMWSVDGTSWKSLSDEPAFSSGPCHTGDDYIAGIYPMGNALVAIGSAAWRSLDGQSWKCVGAGSPQLRITGGHDVFVGSGDADPASPNEYMWLSRDGVDWQR